MHTKSEDIIVKLKHLQRKQFILGNSKFRENIDFIIKTITEENLYELDSVEFSQKVQNKKHNGIDFLVKYSAIEDSNQKEKDFRLLRKKSKMYSSSSLKNAVNAVKVSDDKLNRRREAPIIRMIKPAIEEGASFVLGSSLSSEVDEEDRSSCVCAGCSGLAKIYV